MQIASEQKASKEQLLNNLKNARKIKRKNMLLNLFLFQKLAQTATFQLIFTKYAQNDA